MIRISDEEERSLSRARKTRIKTQKYRRKIQAESKGGDSMEGVGGMIFTAIFWMNDIIDWGGLLLNVSGVWEIIIIVIDLMCLGLFVLYKIMQGEIASLLNWKVILSLIVEHIPVIGDIWPGWITLKRFSKKKK